MTRLASILLKACRGIDICESQGYVLVHICVLLRMCYVHRVLAHVYIVPSPYNSLYSTLGSLLLKRVRFGAGRWSVSNCCKMATSRDVSSP